MITFSLIRFRFLGVFLGISAVGAMAGCTASIETRPVAVSSEADITWEEAPPANVEVYPHETYAGRDVYFIGGSWHYQSGGRWATYRREPQELARRRASRPAPAREERKERR